MSESIEVLEPVGVISNDLRPPNVTIRPRKAKKYSKKIVVAIYQNSSEKVATKSVENSTAKKSMRLNNNIEPCHRLSNKLDDRKDLHVFLLNNGSPKNRNYFPQSQRETGNPNKLEE